MNSAFETRLRETFAGQMNEGELRITNAIQRAVKLTLDGELSFEHFVVALWEDFKIFSRQFGMEVDLALASGFPSAVEALNSEPSVALLASDEASFLRDVDGLLKFVSRNGVSFRLVLSILMQDLIELSRHNWSPSRAMKEACFVPKVSGWAQRNADPIGESEM